MNILDYLKSNCRSWEEDCDNEEDAHSLASHLQGKFPGIEYSKLLQIASDWVGYEPNDEDDERL